MVRQLVSGLTSWRPGFNPRLVHVGFVMDEMALGEVFLLYEFYTCERQSIIPFKVSVADGGMILTVLVV